MPNHEIIIAITIGLLLLAAMGGAGGAILRWSGLIESETTVLKIFPIACAVGFAVYSYLGYAVTLFAPVSPLVIVALAFVGIALGFSYYRDLFSSFRDSYIKELALELKSPLVLLLTFLTLVALSFAAFNWLTPPKEGDALWGYMLTAKWLHSHGLTFIPYNPRYSLFPLNTELVYAFSYSFGTDLIAKFLDGLLGLCFLAALYEHARRGGINRLFSFFAAISLALIPEFSNNWSSGKVDVAACYIFFAGLSLLLLKSELSWSVISLSAFLLGTACSQKYTVWIFVLPLPLVIFLAFRKTVKVKIAKAILLSATIIFLCLIPHTIKNIAWAGNPIAPFAQTIVNPEIKILPHVSDATVLNWRDVPRLPVKLSLDGNKLGPFPLLILLGLPLYLFVKNKSILVQTVLLTGVLQLAIWLVVRQQDWLVGRFLLAQIALLLIPAADGLSRLSENYKSVKVTAVLILICLICYSGIWTVRHRRESLPFIFGLENREQWQERVAPGRCYAVLHRVAPRLDSDDRLMAISYLYNLPEDKLADAGTEAEYYDFINTPDEQKVEYLKRKNFRFYLFTDRDKPAWANELKVFEAGNVPGLEWTLFELNDFSKD